MHRALCLASLLCCSAASAASTVTFSLRDWKGGAGQVLMDVEGLGQPTAAPVDSRGLVSVNLPAPKKSATGGYLFMGLDDSTMTLGNLFGNACPVASGTLKATQPKMRVFSSALEGWVKAGKGFRSLSSRQASSPLPAYKNETGVSYWMVYAPQAAALQGEVTCKPDAVFKRARVNVALKPGWNQVMLLARSDANFNMSLESLTLPLASRLTLTDISEAQPLSALPAPFRALAAKLK